MLKVEDIRLSMEALGISRGDSVIVHSSFKSLGEVEDGAEGVIKGLQSTIGEEGTLIFPTLCQNDWEHVYETWHIDKPSDVGYLTNYFRMLPEAKRSNQATHSVAAIGKYADEITKTHGNSGLRYGIFGDTPFASDSPWEKMYEMGTKVVLIGVSIIYSTFRHLAEYKFMEKCLKIAEKRPDYQELKDRVWCYERFEEQGAWVGLNSNYIEEVLKKEGKINEGTCGNAKVTVFSGADYVNKILELLGNKDLNVLALYPDQWENSEAKAWLEEIGVF